MYPALPATFPTTRTPAHPQHASPTPCADECRCGVGSEAPRAGRQPYSQSMLVASPAATPSLSSIPWMA